MSEISKIQLPYWSGNPEDPITMISYGLKDPVARAGGGGGGSSKPVVGTEVTVFSDDHKTATITFADGHTEYTVFGDDSIVTTYTYSENEVYVETVTKSDDGNTIMKVTEMEV